MTAMMERLVLTACNRMADDEGCRYPQCGRRCTAPADVVRALLAELKSPSEGVLAKGCLAVDIDGLPLRVEEAKAAWLAMLAAIEEGK